jgi:predicted nucleic acid-binding protein
VATDRYDAPYLDSSVFIAWINREVVDGVDRFEIANHIINHAATGDHPIYISALTLAEVNKIPRSKVAPLTPAQNEVLIKFFQNDYFKLLPVDRMIGEMANGFCREYGIMGNDAIHLACALRAKCDVLLVWDRALSKVAHKDIRVEEPRILGQRLLVSVKVSPPTGDVTNGIKETTQPDDVAVNSSAGTGDAAGAPTDEQQPTTKPASEKTPLTPRTTEGTDDNKA